MTVSELSVHLHMITDKTHLMLDMCHSKICRMSATLVPRPPLNPQREASRRWQASEIDDRLEWYTICMHAFPERLLIQREASSNKLTGGGKHLRSTVAVHVHVYYLHACTNSSVPHHSVRLAPQCHAFRLAVSMDT